jgi:hypothetical protein
MLKIASAYANAIDLLFTDVMTSCPRRVVIWGTGMGPIASADNVVPGSIDLKASLNVQVLLDGFPIKPDLYAGRAPVLPGADEIILTLPANVATGCFSTLQVNVNGQLSNLTNISIAAGSESACTAPGFTTEQLARLDQGDDFKMGSLMLSAGTDTSGQYHYPYGHRRREFRCPQRQRTDSWYGGAHHSGAQQLMHGTRQILTFDASGSVPPAFSPLDTGTLTLNGPNVSDATISTPKVAGVTVVNCRLACSSVPQAAGQ